MTPAPRSPLGSTWLLCGLALTALVSTPATLAETTAAPDLNQLWKQAEAQAVHGPKSIALARQAQLQLPAGYLFIPAQPAKSLMQALGNGSDPDLQGLIEPEQNDAQWFVLAEYQAEGYIKDDDAQAWDTEALLKNLKEGTEAANQERRDHGRREMEVRGWIEKPQYNRNAHQLVWSAAGYYKDGSDASNPTVNYHTYALGREGYINLNLVTDLRTVEQQKPIMATLLQQLQFNEGKRYQDFNASTDHVAAYGLAALVGGVALKKMGLFAVLAAFFAKSAKAVVLVALGGLAALRKFFFGDKSDR